MKLPLFRFACLAAALFAVGLLTYRTVDRADAGTPDIVLANGAGSPDELVNRFLAALAANDRGQIESLRVDENEYRNLIMPGSVKSGFPPQLMPDKKSEYFWRQHNTLSVYTLVGLLKGYGGESFRLKKVEYPRVDEFIWYKAYRDPTLLLESEGGEVVELQLGSIAEYRGRYKFISYRSD
jgi:hypothetical protein